MLRQRVKERREQKKNELFDNVSLGSSLDGQSDAGEDDELVQPAVKAKKPKAEGFQAALEDDSSDGDLLVPVHDKKKRDIDEPTDVKKDALKLNKKKMRKINIDGHFDGKN